MQQRPNRAHVPSSLAISESEYFADDDNHAVMLQRLLCVQSLHGLTMRAIHPIRPIPT